MSVSSAKLQSNSLFFKSVASENPFGALQTSGKSRRVKKRGPSPKTPVPSSIAAPKAPTPRANERHWHCPTCGGEKGVQFIDTDSGVKVQIRDIPQSPRTYDFKATRAPNPTATRVPKPKLETQSEEKSSAVRDSALEGGREKRYTELTPHESRCGVSLCDIIIGVEIAAVSAMAVWGVYSLVVNGPY